MTADPPDGREARAPFGVPGFEVLELLGFGGTGEVWLGRELVSGDAVALKRLRPGSEPEATERMRREAALLGSLRHPHLVRLRAVVELPDDFVLVLDHAGNGNLHALLRKRGALAAGEVVTLLSPLAEALEELHRQGVVHGDVAPANIVIDPSGRPLLADLGIARILGTPVGELQGREAFLDPAVLAGQAPTPSADVYALAAVGAAALGSGDEGTQHAQALREVLARALAAESFLRPTAGELAASIYAACPPEPLVLGPPFSGRGSAGLATSGGQAPAPGHAASGMRWPSGAKPHGGDPWGEDPRGEDPRGGDVTHRLHPVALVPAELAPGATRGSRWRRKLMRPTVEPPTAVTSAPTPTSRRASASSPGASEASRWWTRASGEGEQPREGEQREQWHRGPLLFGLAACSGLVLAALVGVAWASLERPGAGMVLADPTPDATTPDLTAPTTTEATEPAPVAPTAAWEPQWSSILAGLDAARAKAYLNGDAALLHSAYAPRAPAGDRDAQSLATLIKADRRIEGLHLSTTAISPREVTSDQAVLRVVDTLAPHVMVELGTGARQTMQGRGERAWTIIVRRADSAWRIWEVMEGGRWPAAEP